MLYQTDLRKSLENFSLGVYSLIMRRFIKILTLSLLFSQILTPANASFNSPINLENPRVVPVFGQLQLQGVTIDAVWSGYLYSPRIVFSAAHSNYKFDNNGNRILSEMALDTVGKPNSNAFDKTGRVKVIKTFIGDYKLTSSGSVNDFIVYVLERDLVPISKGNLLTAEIEKELVAVQSEVKIHGYGEYQDRCPGQPGPCNSFRDPKMRTSEFPRSPTGIMKLVAPSYFPWLSSDQKTDFANETLVSDNLACSGDSGGPVTAVYKGTSYYLGIALSGANVRACGAGRVNDPTKPYGYFSPVYKHLDLIKAAEDFIKVNSATTSKTTITCSKGKSVKKISGANPKCPKGFKRT
jgi:hypothetical protein